MREYVTSRFVSDCAHFSVSKYKWKCDGPAVGTFLGWISVFRNHSVIREASAEAVRRWKATSPKPPNHIARTTYQTLTQCETGRACLDPPGLFG